MSSLLYALATQMRATPADPIHRQQGVHPRIPLMFSRASIARVHGSRPWLASVYRLASGPPAGRAPAGGTVPRRPRRAPPAPHSAPPAGRGGRGGVSGRRCRTA